MFFNICQLLGGFILSIGMVPQIVQLIKTKKADDLNHVSILTVLAGIALMQIYAIGLLFQGVGTAFFITNTAALLLQLTLACFVLKYKFKSKKLKNREGESA